MTAEGAGLYLNYSKNRITSQTLKLLVELAEGSGLQGRIDAMFRGEKVNITEKRPALHIALRAPKGTAIYVDGSNVVPQVHAVLERMGHFCNRVRNGEWKGHTGKRIRNVINIGIGGSHLGPRLAATALKHYADPSLTFRFVSNVDSTDFAEATRDCDPAETLFIVSSKTFKTLETMTNAKTAREWLVAGLAGDQKSTSRHFVAVSADLAGVAQFGIETANTFEFWEWVGGRYSMCSAVGLPTMLAIGPNNFHAMLDGFHQMDMHYLTTPFERNLPVLMGLLNIWYNDLFACDSLAVLPYEHYLELLPSYLQQLIMESNGKRVTLNRNRGYAANRTHLLGRGRYERSTLVLPTLTSGHKAHPLRLHCICGTPSPDRGSSRHAHCQCPCAERGAGIRQDHRAGESRRNAKRLVPHRVFDGNRPSNTIFARQLTPETLGSLIALYEHSVHTQGVIWNINPFDQWGVELGKDLASCILQQLQEGGEPLTEQDSSTER